MGRRERERGEWIDRWEEDQGIRLGDTAAQTTLLSRGRSKQHVGTRNIYGNKRGGGREVQASGTSDVGHPRVDGTHRMLFMGGGPSALPVS